MSNPDYKAVLSLKMDKNDSGTRTVGGYLQELLLKLLHEQDGFSSKRPFGNSGWFACDLAPPLIRAGLVEGELHDGELIDCNEAQLASVLRGAVAELFKTSCQH